MRIEFFRDISQRGFSKLFMADLLTAYFKYHGVFIGEGKNQIWVDYNDLYHFYDISLFELVGNRDTTRHFQEAIKLLKYHGHTISYVTPSWRWEHQQDAPSKNIKGIRFFVDAINPYKKLGSEFLDTRTGELFEELR